MDSSSTSGVGAGFVSRERGPLDDLRDDSTITLILFSRFIIKNAAIKITTRIKTAPPMIPPSWAFVRPPLEGFSAFVLGIEASGLEVTFATRPLVVGIPVGA